MERGETTDSSPSVDLYVTNRNIPAVALFEIIKQRLKPKETVDRENGGAHAEPERGMDIHMNQLRRSGKVQIVSEQ